MVCFKWVSGFMAFIPKAHLCVVYNYNERKTTANVSQPFHNNSTLETMKENNFLIIIKISVLAVASHLFGQVYEVQYEMGWIFFTFNYGQVKLFPLTFQCTQII